MEEQAFRQAVEDHRDVVFRIALTYLRDRADADDVAQDVFLKLLKSDAQFESWEHLRRWLIRVTINECKSLFRKPWRRVRILRTWPIRFRRRRRRPRRSCQTLCDFRNDSVFPSCSITIWAFRPQRLPS
ncbi:RNA polymerase sigma factor [Collinsella aerofaciens]|uniref:RNA polymerase sigma factor n=1 Tax=Collinsella aerofaciens TaxID=74426 RepID=UPI00232FF72B|nr:RNA polymerase sigma factor [Collinsella aerofaciens]MDB1895441.1 RNA polymerase sigma factor [Collinsella aerofaciens]MDB1899507.1 RNA polymerase sigma factor [Collinsella aerofaciens]